MKPDIRWQILLALAGLSLVLMLLSLQVQSSALCFIKVPASGGTFTEGMVGRLTAINPLLSDPYPVDREIVDLIFDGLVRFDETGAVSGALAESWSISEDGRVLTFTLREDALWHDGQPVTAEDVAFTYGLLQDESFSGPPNLISFWQPITIEVISPREIRFTLPQSFAPFLTAVSRGILPVHILGGLSAAELATSSFNVAPVGTGPFRVEAGQNWVQSGRLRLLPNSDYWRDGTQISEVEIQFFPNEQDMIAAFQVGDIHAANGIPASMLNDLVEFDRARLFTSSVPRYSSVLFNLTDTGHPAIQTKEVRQAMAYGLNRPQLIDEILNGQGIIFEGPYLPDSWVYRSDLLTSYTYQPDVAATLLDQSGWISGGGGVRQREDVAFSVRLLSLARPDHMAIVEALAQQWQALGIEVVRTSASDIEQFRSLLAGREFDVALTEVLAPDDPDLYDFWSQEAIIRGQNYAGWNNRRASEALENGRQLYNQTDRTLYYESFIRQFENDLPALTLFQHVDVYGVSDTVQQAEIGRIWQPRERFQSFASWFLNFRDVTIECP